MPKRKLQSSDESLEAMVNEYLSVGEEEGGFNAPSPPLKSEDSSQGNNAMNEERKTIVEVVEADGHLLEVIQRLLELKFLVPGVFHPLAYLRDTDRIESAWKKSKSKDNALAMGVH